MIEIIRIVNGILEENCYIIKKDKNALIIDPGSVEVIPEIKKLNLNISGILITHYHFDHIGALEELKKIYNKAKLIDYQSEKNIKLDNFKFEIIENYGHTMDSVSFYFKEDEVLFTGDFIFKETIGNFSSENEISMANSLFKIKEFNKCTKIYPGHGEDSTMEHELNYNPFLRGL